ncbi:hypothetical protein SG09_52180 [Bradyrhizobium ottawaense]|nr:hypothetical protein SG09_52180 [Bradyrhizobium ottawaense]GMO22792.1 hypothetical protein BwSF12_15370 [Bradyrhizobium ottawaense]GMO48208.1 hypothetical protein BwSH14_66690 [Bradyrhizobium ottawaense]GMO82014.1 hypothetical protein BwSG20_63330 [Bradyrhizobium ottawaense]GMO84354.1 hypothetical protein BwSG10_62040 [Bradyrhizobium ottawaense]
MPADGDGIGVGDGVGVGVGVGVGLCAKTGDVADIKTIANAVAIAAATLRTRSSPIVCRVPEGCGVQHMTTNPEANGGAQKCNTRGARMSRFVPNCHGGSTA